MGVNYNLMSSLATREGPSSGRCKGCKWSRHLYGVMCCAEPSLGPEGSMMKIGSVGLGGEKTPGWCPVLKRAESCG